jgi:hypothetical protein
MRVDVTPDRLQVLAGAEAILMVQVRNTGDVIEACTVRIIGLDAAWVAIDGRRLSLFPGDSGVATVRITLPEGLPAGTRRLGVEVTSELDGSSRMAEVALDVPSLAKATMEAEPQAVTAGRKAALALTLANGGNTTLELIPEGADQESKVSFEFVPPVATVDPGAEVSVKVSARARRPLLGQPKLRVLTLRTRGVTPPPERTVTFMQRPIISRGLLSLLGLLAAVTVFGTVLTIALSRVVDASSVDEELLLRAINGPDGDDGPTNPGSISGRVLTLSSGAPLAGASVQLFAADSGEEALDSTATSGSGTFTLDELEAGTYKIQVLGAGFGGVWFPAALDFDDAGEIEVVAGEATAGIDVRVGGLPGVISGDVLGEDPAGATVALLVPASVIGSTTDAVVTSVVVDATGDFRLEPVPSPGSFILEATKPGFARETRAVSLGPAQVLEGVEITLQRGDGAISGRIFGAAGPLDAVAVSATTTTSGGAVTVSTTTLASGDFTLRNLPTPAQYTITLTKAEYGTETLAVNLGAAQELSGISATLVKGNGSIAGTVSVVGRGPTGGITVTATDAEQTFTTRSLSAGAVGTYLITGLPLPGTYTVTFAGPGLASQTRSVHLDPISGGNVTGVDATLTRATGTISGIVFAREIVDGPALPIGGATVTAASGVGTQLVTTSATVASQLGHYEFPEVVPGTYTVTFSLTGRAPHTQLITVAAGQTVALDGTLEPLGTILGRLCTTAGCWGGTPPPIPSDDPADCLPPGDGTPGDDTPLVGAEIRLYLHREYPTVLRATTAGPDGRFEFQAVFGPEDYIIEVIFGGAILTPSQTFFVEPSGTVCLALVRGTP